LEEKSLRRGGTQTKRRRKNRQEWFPGAGEKSQWLGVINETLVKKNKVGKKVIIYSSKISRRTAFDLRDKLGRKLNSRSRGLRRKG